MGPYGRWPAADGPRPGSVPGHEETPIHRPGSRVGIEVVAEGGFEPPTKGL